MSPSDAARHVLLRADQFEAPPPPFRTGAAGLVRLAPDGMFELEERVFISANSAHALLGHGVVARLEALGLEGRIGSGAPAMIRPGQIESARSIFYEADRRTYGGCWEFVVERTRDRPPIEYRVRVENREYQKTLVRLVDVMHRASRHGEAAWIVL